MQIGFVCLVVYGIACFFTFIALVITSDFYQFGSFSWKHVFPVAGRIYELESINPTGRVLLQILANLWFLPMSLVFLLALGIVGIGYKTVWLFIRIFGKKEEEDK